MINRDSSLINLAKKTAGEEAAKYVQDGMLVGLGTGSTVSYFIEALGRRCQNGLHIQAVASSLASQEKALALGIPLKDEQLVAGLDLTVDGADEIDSHFNMIKGGGGALLREKLLAQASQEMIIIVDEAKIVQTLGKFPVAVEISPFLYQTTLKRLKQKGYDSRLRLNAHQTPYVTDNGHYLADLHFHQPIINPKEEHDRLRLITGVLETGLFFDVATRLIIGYGNGEVKIQT